ncbi:hypothetical protein EYC59_04210 [Candidatus Saccharibacteria bacterium]|nr:MAG: hypothetical protein EYC59_04210 [Candidatus Saccharibacteria bacterium]
MSIAARKLQRAKHGNTSSTPSANLYVTPTSGSYGYGATVTVQVYEDSGSTPVNGVQFDMTYPTSELQYVSSSNSGSPFTATLQNTGGSGTVNIAYGTLSGPVSGAQLVATILFKVVASTGTAAVAFGNNCFVTEAATSNNIVSGKTGASYTCVPGAALTLTPASGSYSNGATVTASLYVDSGTTPINGVEAYLTYPTGQLQFGSISNSGSPFTTLIQQSGGGGNVHLAVGALGGSASGSQLAATITFTAVGTGSANVAFTSGGLVTQESNGNDILSNTTGATYTIT